MVPEIYGKNVRLKNRGMCFFVIDCISPEPLELQKSYFRLLASLPEELSDEKRIFQIRPQDHLILAGIELTYKQVSGTKNRHATSSSQARCFCVFLWIWFSSAVITIMTKWKKLFDQINALLKGYILTRKGIWFVHYCYHSW